MQGQIIELNIPNTDEKILEEINKKILVTIEQLKKAQEELIKEMRIKGLL